MLAQLAIFEPLRADELARIARRFTRVTLAPDAQHASANPALVVVVRGEVDVEVREVGDPLRARMAAGDSIGATSLLAGDARPTTFTAHRREAVIATLDRAGFEAVLAEFPVVALPMSRELATELAVRDDYVRQLLELRAARLPADQLRAAIAERRTARRRRGARIARMSTRGTFRRLVIERGAEPAFWMLVGFVASLGGARLVVHLILKYKLEKQLFALVPGTDPNPMHVHHFNYGLLLIGVVGIVALVPRGRRALRGLALVFGLGAGLVFDEFALFWNLDPEYAQRLSLVAAGIAAAVLVQLVYFRTFWATLARRTANGLRGAR